MGKKVVVKTPADLRPDSPLTLIQPFLDFQGRVFYHTWKAAWSRVLYFADFFCSPPYISHPSPVIALCDEIQFPLSQESIASWRGGGGSGAVLIQLLATLWGWETNLFCGLKGHLFAGVGWEGKSQEEPQKNSQ